MADWFLDLDDTLVVGPVTWAIETVLPRLMGKYGLVASPSVLAEALREGQARAASGSGEDELLELFFSRLGWPGEIKRELVQEVFENYRPKLFSDALAFLRWLADERQGVYILSNNNHAEMIMQALGFSPYVQACFTPERCGVPRGKPYPDLWRYITSHHTVGSAVLVGDDPWSDGAFADECGLTCFIVDRLDRFGDLKGFRRVKSLSDIVLLGGETRE